MTERTSFREVKAEIHHRITRGPWGPGTLLPGEVDLAAAFGVSRATINRALRELAEEGLIDRKRKAGTRVRMAPLREARFEIPLVRAEVEGAGATYGYRLIEREVRAAPKWLSDLLGLPDGARVLHLVCLHSTDDEAYQLEDRWINLAALPQAETHDFSSEGPNEWLIATVPFSQAEIVFEAVAAGPAEVEYLGHLAGGPVFRVLRTTRWQDAPITHVRLSHRAGHRMTTRY